MRRVLYIFLALATISLFVNNAAGPAARQGKGYTGAPGDEPNTCVTCHSAGTFGTTATIQVFDSAGTTAVTKYALGKQYTLRMTITAASGTPSGYGFQMIDIRKSDNTNVKGFLAKADQAATVNITTITSGRVYAEHGARLASNVINVKWKAPATDLGTVVFYAAGNAVGADGYVQGYGRYAQDVVIPAFIAAYTGKDPSSVNLIKNSNSKLRSNPFSGLIPKPNWTVSFNGLSRLAGLDKIFTTINIRHGYHGSLSMNSFNSALYFQDPFRVGFPYFRDSVGYIPYFLVPNITIQETFDPMIELDMTFTNQMTFRFEYRKSRQLSLSLIDYQLAENRSEEVTFGFNWRKRGIPFLKNVKIGKNGEKLDNDVTFKFDFSLRDDATANTKLDQNTSYGTSGQKVIRIAPSIDYVLNKRVSLQLYFEQNRSIPKISNSFPITNTRGGLKVRISLSQ